MKGGKAFVLFLLCFVFVLARVSAIGITLSDVNSTLTTVQISSASNLYAYEVALDYTGSVSESASSAGFLSSDGASTSYGSTKKNSIFKIYESRLDNSQTGISGSGDLFNVSYSSSLSRRYLLAVYADGSSEYIYYNNTQSNVSEGDNGGGSSGGSSGGGAGGAGGTSYGSARDANLNLGVQEMIVSLVINQPSTRSFTIENNGNKTLSLNISSYGLDSIISLPNNLVVAPGEKKEVSVIFSTAERKLFVGEIILSVGNLPVKRLPVIVNVRSENFLFDTSINLARQYRKITPGKNIVAQINLLEVGKADEKIDVVANYFVRDFEGNSFLEESETFSVVGSREYTKELFTEHLPVGKYVLAIEISYAGAFATSSSQFEIVPKAGFSVYVAAIAIAAVILGVIIVWIWAKNRKSIFRQDVKR